MNKKKVSLSFQNKGFESIFISPQLTCGIPVLLMSLFSYATANNILGTVDNEELQSELDLDLPKMELLKFLEFARDIVKHDPRFICNFLENYFDMYQNLKDEESVSSSFKCFVSLYEDFCYLLSESDQSGFICPEEDPSSVNLLSSSFTDFLCVGMFVFLGVQLAQGLDFILQNKSKEIKNEC